MTWFRISSMRRNTIIISISALVVVVASWVIAFLWIQGQRTVYLDRLNRLDYAFVSQDDVSGYLMEDLGVSLDKLTKTAPADSGIRSFPELYLAARVLGQVGDSELSVDYYLAAENKLSGYHRRQDVTADFYMAYISQAAISKDRGDIEAVAKRASGAFDGLRSISDTDRRLYEQAINVYVTGEGPVDEEE